VAADPVVVLVTCHDLGRHLGLYGRATVPSPRLDALGASGTVFDAAFCTAPQCSPARASMSTGRYPHRHGLLGLAHPPYDFRLRRAAVTTAAHLGARGFGTHLFGLQHVAASPPDAGFATVHPYSGPAAIGADIAAQVERFTRALPPGPLYVEVNLEEPHRPYDQGGAVPDDPAAVQVPAFLPDGPASRSEIAALHGAIRHADAAVGRIAAAFLGSARAGEVVLGFAADHGLAMPGAKCTLYDPGLEITLLLAGAGIPAGQRRSDLVSGVDVGPTLCARAGVDAPSGVDGRDLLAGVLAGGPPRELVFAEKTFHSYYDPMRAVRSATAKLIVNFGVGFRVEVPGDVTGGAIFRSDPGRYTGGPHPVAELYDLRADPLERHNLLDGDARPPAFEELRAALLAWMRHGEDPLLEARGPLLAPQHRRALHLLGA
jgi:N-sulfoglucosamine sulfohydrolase